MSGGSRQRAPSEGDSGEALGLCVAVASDTALVGTGVSGSPVACVFARKGSTGPQARLHVGRGMMSVALSSFPGTGA